MANFGVGNLQVYELRLLPLIAGQQNTAPFNISLSVAGSFVACTVGKYAEAVETEKGAAEGSFGYYYSLFKGAGSRLAFYWASVPESAIKLMYIISTSPYFYTATVVGEDGSPVPAAVLKALVVRGAAVGDGKVAFEDYAVIKAGDREIRVEPNATAVVPGRRCVVEAKTSLGTPLPLTVKYGGVEVARGVGRADTYCIDGAYTVEYKWEKRGPVSFSLAGAAQGNATVPSAKVRFVALNIFRMPAASAEEEVPQGGAVRLELGDYAGEVVANSPTVVVSKYQALSPTGAASLAALAGALALKPLGGRWRRPAKLLAVAGGVLALAELLTAVFWGRPPSTAAAYSAVATPLVVLAVAIPWRLWHFAAAFAPAVALYGAFAYSLLYSTGWVHLLAPLLAALIFFWAVEMAKRWLCGKCARGYQLGAPQLAIHELWARALRGAARDWHKMEETMGKLKGFGLEDRLNCLREQVFNKVGQIWNEACGVTYYDPTCLYIEGKVDWGGYKALRAFMIGRGGEEDCIKALQAVGLGQFSSLCKGP
ncbi:hypothetical protein [Pyrobaculum sp.]|uniref:hypothetical protein n=1 Tax=Pyrobaculum sp. TaxID=2004705 RepID=UPI00315FF83E